MGKTKYVLVAALIATLLACTLGSPAGDETGSLIINLDPATARTIEPPISMDCAAYQVTVTNSHADIVFDQEVTEGPVLIEGLIPDVYDVLVIGKNDSGLAIGEGSQLGIAVDSGDHDMVTIVVDEYDGTGGLDLAVSWPAGIILDPEIDSTIAYEGGAAEPMAWTLDGDLNGSTFLDTAMANGWYALTYILYENGAAEQAGGFATLARVVKDQTTVGEINLQPNVISGDLEILIDLDFKETLPITADVAEGTYTLLDGDAPMTINVDADASYGAVVWAWYENGSAVGATDSFTIDPSTLETGNHYRYDLLAISSDGLHGASMTWEVDISEAVYTLAFQWDIAANEDPYGSFHVITWQESDGAKVVDESFHVGTQGWSAGDTVSHIVDPLPAGDYFIMMTSTANGGEMYNEAGNMLQPIGLSIKNNYYDYPAEYQQCSPVTVPHDGTTIYDFDIVGQ